MNKYFEYYQIGFLEGLKESIVNNKIKNFKMIDDKELKSKLYDIGYIEGYKFASKNISLKNNKNIV